MIQKIISGGQTGADMAGLWAALAASKQTGGTVPKDYRNEDGDARLHLQPFNVIESDSSDYRVRTRKNVVDSDGTIVFYSQLTPGTKYTINQCKFNEKPCLKVRLNKPSLSTETLPENFNDWVKDNNIKVLNVAGSRESKVPGITKAVMDILGLFLEYEKQN
jgi:hypothetical protein